MNTELIRKWVTALRSGKFTQARTKLARINADGTMSYCCLGVLCEIAVADGIIEPGVNASCDCKDPDCVVSAARDYLSYSGTYAMPPDTVFRAVYGDSTESALGDTDNWVVADPIIGYRIGLADLNDCKEYTFDQIADAIENTWLTEKELVNA